MIQKIVIIYLLIINIVTFIIRGIDKWKSIRHKRRISEKQLLICCAAGGFFGGIIGMTVRHHKTIKGKFLWKFWLIVLVWMIALILIYFYY